jgi:6-pyruvoyltetrahydropterin/6-carboxytetrahydropterin synthase
MASVKPKIVTICRKIAFSSGHRYFNPGLSEEENRKLFGDSYTESGFGNNFILEAYVDGEINSKTGMVINLRELDGVLKDVVRPLDHHFLNTDVAYFREVIPTAENLAIYCFSAIQEYLRDKPIDLRRVRIFEGPDFWVDYPAES